MNIAGKLAIVAGGASGMGEAVCRILAAQGAKVAVLDKNATDTQRVAQAINGTSLVADVTQAEALEQAFEDLARTQAAPLAIAVNCAGVAPAKKMVGKSGVVSLEWFTEVIQINLIGTFNVMRLAAQAMIAAAKQAESQQEEHGVIINTASIAAFEGQIGQTAYSASKGGVVAMTLPAARELAEWGIRVMAIAPGLVDTPMIQKMDDTIKTALADHSVFPKRLGAPLEFAQLVTHIINNPFLNGEVIRLDGAVRLK